MGCLRDKRVYLFDSHILFITYWKLHNDSNANDKETQINNSATKK